MGNCWISLVFAKAFANNQYGFHSRVQLCIFTNKYNTKVCMLNTYTKKPRMVQAVIYLHLLSEKYISIYFHGVLLPTEAYMTTPRSMVRRSLAQPIGIPLRSQAASRSCHIWEEDESKGWI